MTENKASPLLSSCSLWETQTPCLQKLQKTYNKGYDRKNRNLWTHTGRVSILIRWDVNEILGFVTFLEDFSSVLRGLRVDWE